MVPKNCLDRVWRDGRVFRPVTLWPCCLNIVWRCRLLLFWNAPKSWKSQNQRTQQHQWSVGKSTSIYLNMFFSCENERLHHKIWPLHQANCHPPIWEASNWTMKCRSRKNLLDNSVGGFGYLFQRGCDWNYAEGGFNYDMMIWYWNEPDSPNHDYYEKLWCY